MQDVEQLVNFMKVGVSFLVFTLYFKLYFKSIYHFISNTPDYRVLAPLSTTSPSQPLHQQWPPAKP